MFLLWTARRWRVWTENVRVPSLLHILKSNRTRYSSFLAICFNCNWNLFNTHLCFVCQFLQPRISFAYGWFGISHMWSSISQLLNTACRRRTSVNNSSLTVPIKYISLTSNTYGMYYLHPYAFFSLKCCKFIWYAVSLSVLTPNSSHISHLTPCAHKTYKPPTLYCLSLSDRISLAWFNNWNQPIKYVLILRCRINNFVYFR